MARKVIDQIKKFIDFLQHDLWRIDLVHDTKLHFFGVEVLRVTHLVIKGTKDDKCHLHASALTYSTLMALVPFLVVVFSVGKAIGFTAAEESVLKFSAEMPEQIQTFFQNVLEIVGGINPAALGTVGGVVFLIIIFKLLSGIEESFNQIWGVQASRAVGQKIRNYLLVIVIAPALMLVANTSSAAIQAFAGEVAWLGTLSSWFIQLAPVLILALAFVAIFMFLPNTKVGFKAAASGGISSALLIIIVQAIILKFSTALFQKYAIYGSFASIPIFLFWLHLNWIILLFGAEFAFAIQNRDTYAQERSSVHANMVSKLWVAFSTMQESVRVFQGSEASLDTKAYAREKNIPVRLMNEVVRVLEGAHLLGSVGAEGETRYALLQAPENITAKKVYDLMITHGASPEELGLAKDHTMEEILSAANITLDRITLREFIDKS